MEGDTEDQPDTISVSSQVATHQKTSAVLEEARDADREEPGVTVGEREMGHTVTTSSLKDCGRSWLVCFAAFLIQVLNVGVMHVFGVFFVAFLDDFNKSKAETGQLLCTCDIKIRDVPIGML